MYGSFFCLESDEEFPVALGNPEKTETCVEEKKVICHCIPDYCMVYRTVGTILGAINNLASVLKRFYIVNTKCSTFNNRRYERTEQ
jgi:hypothetical protein